MGEEQQVAGELQEEMQVLSKGHELCAWVSIWDRLNRGCGSYWEGKGEAQ